MSDETRDYHYDLPAELIAQSPADRRDASRLLVCRRSDGLIEHRRFYELGDHLKPGDCLVLNNSRVIPARLLGERAGGSSCELLLLRDLGGDVWECLAKPGRRLPLGAKVSFGAGELQGEVVAITDTGNRHVRFAYDGLWQECLAQLGTMPLPPYITKKLESPGRYQTVYAREDGSAAAPTAGLHFTEDLLSSLRGKGVHIAELTLHVGLGTFRPVKVRRVDEHIMHSERYTVSPEAAAVVNSTRRAGGRIIAVGTTSCRTLEAAAKDGELQPGSGETDIFIRPGYGFQLTDALLTNFHLPESTLVMLVSALYGRERTLTAYGEAVRQGYRFFSFGDAMLIV